HGEAGGRSHSLVSSARDLKEDFLLALQHDLAIVEPTRGIHHAIQVDELLPRQALVGLACLIGLSNSAGFSVAAGRHGQRRRVQSSAKIIVNQVSALGFQELWNGAELSAFGFRLSALSYEPSAGEAFASVTGSSLV